MGWTNRKKGEGSWTEPSKIYTRSSKKRFEPRSISEIAESKKYLEKPGSALVVSLLKFLSVESASLSGGVAGGSLSSNHICGVAGSDLFLDDLV